MASCDNAWKIADIVPLMRSRFLELLSVLDNGVFLARRWKSVQGLAMGHELCVKEDARSQRLTWFMGRKGMSRIHGSSSCYFTSSMRG